MQVASEDLIKGWAILSAAGWHQRRMPARRSRRNVDRERRTIAADRQLGTPTLLPDRVEFGRRDLEVPLVLGFWKYAPDRQLTMLVPDVYGVIQQALTGVVDLDLARCHEIRIGLEVVDGRTP